ESRLIAADEAVRTLGEPAPARAPRPAPGTRIAQAPRPRANLADAGARPRETRPDGRRKRHPDR
ncbi:hypothetical protein ABTB38_18295, partial [Acinetobacter baumannii]